MVIILILLYLLACSVTAFMGRNTAAGFMGHFLLSLVLTPILDFVIQVVARPNARIREKIETLDRD